MKKIYYILLAFILLFSFNVSAGTKTYERNKGNNYGIKKKIIDTSDPKVLEAIMKTKYVNASEKIYDFSNILTDDEEHKLKQLIDKFHKKTKMEIVIVTDNLPYEDDADNMLYAEDFYDYNDFGLDTEHFDGIILFRNTYPADPYYDMTLTGRAQLYYHTRIDNILDNIYEDIHAGRYLNGFTDFIERLDSYYDSGIPSEMQDYDLDEHGNLIRDFYEIIFDTNGGSYVPTQKVKKGEMIEKPADPTKDGYEFVEWRYNGMKYDFSEPPIGDMTIIAEWKKIYQMPTILMIISSIVGTSVFTGINVKKNKMVKHIYEANTFLDKSSINYTNITDNLINTSVSKHYINHDHGSSGGGFSSGGGGGFSSHSGSSGIGHSSGGRHG